MSAFISGEADTFSEQGSSWVRSIADAQECVFKKCCKSYKTKGKRCKKCPKK